MILFSIEAQRDCSVKTPSFDHSTLMSAPPPRETEPQFSYDWKLFPISPGLAFPELTHARTFGVNRQGAPEVNSC